MNLNKEITIAIIEDNPLILKLLKKLLSRHYHVVSFSKCHDFYSFKDLTKISLAIIDYYLPDGTANDVLKYLHDHNLTTVGLILLSATDIKYNGPFHVDAIVKKPWGNHNFIDCVNQIIHSRIT